MDGVSSAKRSKPVWHAVPLPVEIAGETRKILLEEAEWPFKQLLAPLFNVTSFGTGMPSAMGRLPNPLLAEQSVMAEDDRQAPG